MAKTGKGFDIGGILMAIRGTRTNLAPAVRKQLEQFGGVEITGMSVVRHVIQAYVSKFIKIANKISKYAPKIIHDKLFHLFLVCKLANGMSIRLEKNEMIGLRPYIPETGDESVIILNVPRGLTLNSLIQGAIKSVGPERVFHYDAFTNNCQRFVLDVLEDALPISQTVRDFIMQDVSELAPHWVKRLGHFFTDLFNRMKTIVQGKGYSPEEHQENKDFIQGLIGAPIMGKGTPIFVKSSSKGYQTKATAPNIQAILFNSNTYSAREARQWLARHKHEPIKRVHRTANYLRYRLQDPRDGAKYKTIDFGHGIKAIAIIQNST
jgi:hypothetical protein